MSSRKERRAAFSQPRGKGGSWQRLCAHAWHQDPGPEAWCAPLRRVRRDIDSTFARIESSGRVLDATMRFAAGRPAEASRRLHHVSQWLIKAQAELQQAIEGTAESFGQITLDRVNVPGAPVLLLDILLRWITALDMFTQLSFSLLDATVRVNADPRSQAPSVERFSGLAVPRSRIPRPIVRLPRPSVTTTADGARSISRGRAPPSFRLPLQHRG